MFGFENLSVDTWFTSMLSDARYTLFIEANTTTENSDITVANMLLVIFMFCLSISAELHFIFILLAFGVSSGTIWLATTNFTETSTKQQLCDSEHPPQYTELLLKQTREKYGDLMELVDKVNLAWSSFGIYVILDVCIWLSSDLDLIWRSTNYIFSIYTCCIVGYLAVAMTLSAESSRKVGW